MHDDPEDVERRVIPALVAVDPELGEIRWERWERSLQLTHIPGDCQTCAFPGPMRNARGLTLHQDRPRRDLLRHSRIAEGRRAVWGPVYVPEKRWVYTHWASRCPRCDEMEVWRTRGWVRVQYHPPTTERAVSPRDDVLF